MSWTAPLIRNATSDDWPELERLVHEWAAERGLDPPTPVKMRAAFARAVAKDGSMLVVAPGQPRLKGALLFGPITDWHSDNPRLAEVWFYLDRGHRRSREAKALRKLAQECRQNGNPAGEANGAAHPDETQTMRALGKIADIAAREIGDQVDSKITARVVD
jgi:L-amino acid N-acyltransferase YncA